MLIQAPIEIEMKLSIISDDGTQGYATIGLGKGTYPSEKKMRDRVMKFEKEEMPDGFRLMNKREWWDTVCPPTHEEDENGEIYTSRFAIPGDEIEWDL